MKRVKYEIQRKYRNIAIFADKNRNSCRARSAQRTRPRLLRASVIIIKSHFLQYFLQNVFVIKIKGNIRRHETHHGLSSFRAAS